MYIMELLCSPAQLLPTRPCLHLIIIYSPASQSLSRCVEYIKTTTTTRTAALQVHSEMRLERKPALNSFKKPLVFFVYYILHLLLIIDGPTLLKYIHQLIHHYHVTVVLYGSPCLNYYPLPPSIQPTQLASPDKWP